jgi:hypothetical protein
MNINRFTGNMETPFHSSGYAEAANGKAIGVQSGQSFTQRTNIERSRQMVQRYHDSHIGRGALQFRRETSLPQRVEGPSTPARHSRQIPSPRSKFVEPPVRSYNPYK